MPSVYSNSLIFNSSLKNKYLVLSYDDISVPNNTFFNNVILNPLHGVTYDLLRQRGAVHICVPTGGRDLLDYDMTLGNRNYYRTNGGTYYEESY